MRPGLVGAGAALLVLGAAVVAGALAAPPPSVTGTTHRISVHLTAGASAAVFAWGVNESATVLAVAWQSTGPVNVSLAAPTGCTGVASTCRPGSVLVAWAHNVSGGWTTSGSITYPLLLTVRNGGLSAVTTTVVVSSEGSSGVAVPAWAFYSEVIGGVALSAIGSLALFLGLFLRAGVFARPAPPPRGPAG